ncbi:hypothetical protein LTR04_005399 [Oleoguttula sp. CCFEE 6159]|nr:hypothetical protein LTR04_005399 [Oleoguttula sp. CCFEE 6159]
MPGPGLPDPAFASHDLDERTILAYEEGHDADISSNIGFIPEKHSSSTESVHELTDLEKGSHTSSSSITAADAPAGPPNPNIVWWDSDQDPANPMNWSMKLKWGNIAVLSTITLITPLASSMFAPGVPQVMKDFKSSNQQLATIVVSVYVLGFAFGPLVIAPLSELYGRLRIYHGCNLLFVIFTIACAVSSNLNMLIGFRFLGGCVGVAPLTIGGGTIADVMPQERRGGAMAIWALGPLLGSSPFTRNVRRTKKTDLQCVGPVLGPVAGGYLCQAKGWRWVFYLIAIMVRRPAL